MTGNIVSYNFETMPKFQPDRPGGGKSLQQLKQDQDKVFQVYKQEGQIKNKEIIATYLSYDEASGMCNELNNK